jgi:hypothetical protein
VPELNVQNGVLKALSFLFEYIGEMGKDYIYAVTPLLEDALMDRDLVHRQTAASVVQVGLPTGSRQTDRQAGRRTVVSMIDMSLDGVN